MCARRWSIKRHLLNNSRGYQADDQRKRHHGDRRVGRAQWADRNYQGDIVSGSRLVQPIRHTPTDVRQ